MQVSAVSIIGGCLIMSIKTSISKFDATSFRETPEGYLDAAVQPTRTGVFNYFYGGQMVRELRRPEQVFKQDSLETLQNKSVTNDHPRDAFGAPIFLNAGNVRQYEVGSVYGTHAVADDGVHTAARVIIKDAETIKAVKSGKVQVSCGYTCDYLDEPGEYQGLKYDREQVNIRDYNHLAIVSKGRAGSGAVIKFDGQEIDETEDYNNLSEDYQPMVKVKFDGAEIEISESAVETIVNAEAKRKADAEQLQATVTERDELKGKFDALQQELKSYQDKEASAAKQALAALAAPYLPEQKLDGMTEREIKAAVINAKYDTLDLGQKTDGEISGMFEIVIAQPAKVDATPNAKKLDEALSTPSQNKNVDLISAARSKQIQMNRGY